MPYLMMILVRSSVKEEDYSVESKLSFTPSVAHMRASAVFHRSAGKGVAELLFGDLTKYQAEDWQDVQDIKLRLGQGDVLHEGISPKNCLASFTKEIQLLSSCQWE